MLLYHSLNQWYILSLAYFTIPFTKEIYFKVQNCFFPLFLLQVQRTIQGERYNEKSEFMFLCKFKGHFLGFLQNFFHNYFFLYSKKSKAIQFLFYKTKQLQQTFHFPSRSVNFNCTWIQRRMQLFNANP